jgi:hypothetical protein
MRRKRKMVVNIPLEISSRTSQTELVRDGEKLWLNSSRQAIRATKTIGARSILKTLDPK